MADNKAIEVDPIEAEIAKVQMRLNALKTKREVNNIKQRAEAYELMLADPATKSQAEKAMQRVKTKAVVKKEPGKKQNTP